MNIPKKAKHSGRNQYELVLERIVKAIYDGIYRPGMKMPSVRDLAAKYTVGRKVAHSALEKLARAGYLYSEPKRGFYVNPTINPGLFYRIAFYSRGLNPLKSAQGLHEAYTLCESRGFDIICGSDYMNGNETLTKFVAKHREIDALLIGGEITEKFLEKEAVPLGIPYIVLGNYEISGKHESELVDVYKKTYDSVFGVFKKYSGKKMAGLMGTGEFFTDRESKRAILDAANDAGLKTDTDLMPFSQTGGLAELTRIVAEYSPEVIFFNGGMYESYIRYINTGHDKGGFTAIGCGNIPNELKEHFDDLVEMNLFPASCIRSAAQKLLDKLEHKEAVKD